MGCLDAAARRAPAAEIRRNGCNRAGEFSALTSYLARYPRQLSGGQRTARRHRDRAIVRDPKVSCSTEPLSNLAPSCGWRCAPRIKALHQRLEDHDDLCTHDQIEA